MKPIDLLQHLQSRGITFEVIPGAPNRLRMNDPKELTSKEQREFMSSVKTELIEFLLCSTDKCKPKHNSNARLHFLDSHGCVTTDPAKCYMWTRQQSGYGWWYAADFPPPPT
ncbi:MAG: hypothetical protein QM703_28580 [Gemmatales bacterium]